MNADGRGFGFSQRRQERQERSNRLSGLYPRRAVISVHPRFQISVVRLFYRIGGRLWLSQAGSERMQQLSFS
jgi:hypothetical protein